MIEVRRTIQGDAESLAPRMREADKAEVKAASGKHPYLALLEGIDCSEQAYTAEVGGEPIAIFGVCPTDNPSVGVVWLLGSDVISKHRIDFLRKSRDWVDHFQTKYPVLCNAIDARNTVHIRWLQWLGFTFIQELPNHGVENRLFYQFVRIHNV